MPFILPSLVISIFLAPLACPQDCTYAPPLIIRDSYNSDLHRNNLKYGQWSDPPDVQKIISNSKELKLMAKSEASYWWTLLTETNSCGDYSSYDTYEIKVRAPPGAKFQIEIQGSNPVCRQNEFTCSVKSTDYYTFTIDHYWVEGECNSQLFKGYLPNASKAGVRCCNNGLCVPQPDNQCYNIATYYDAAKICSDNGTQLCTKEELQMCCGVGCNNTQSVWTTHLQGEQAYLRIPLDKFQGQAGFTTKKLWAISLVKLTPNFEFLFDYLAFQSCQMKRINVLKIETPESYCLQNVKLLAGVEYILSSNIKLSGYVTGSLSAGDQSLSFCFEDLANPWCISPDKSFYNKHISIMGGSYTFEYMKFTPKQDGLFPIRLGFDESINESKSSIFFGGLFLGKVITVKHGIPQSSSNILQNHDFAMYDMRNWSCHGSWSINIENGFVVAPTSSPTPVPTESPTPSSAPTVSPTESPTVSPTDPTDIIVHPKDTSFFNENAVYFIIGIGVLGVSALGIIAGVFFQKKKKKKAHSVPLLTAESSALYQTEETPMKVVKVNGIWKRVPITRAKRQTG